MAEFNMNFKNKYYIDIAPESEEPSWAELAPGIMNVAPAPNDVLSEDNYYDGNGFGETEVVGVKPTFAISGHRKVGDAAQDFIEARAFGTGAERRTNFKWEKTNGRTLIWPVTIVNPVVSGGDAQSKETFSCELRANGAPTTDSAAS